MHHLAVALSARLIHAGAEEKNLEIFVYAIETLLSIFFMVLGFLLLGLLTGRLSDILLWQTALLGLRIPLGGYHASTHARCQAMSFTLAGASLIITPYMPPAVSLLLCGAMLPIVIWIAPVIHEAQPQTAREKRRARLLAIGVVCAEFVMIIFLCMSGLAKEAAVVAAGNACATLPALYTRMRGRTDQ